MATLAAQLEEVRRRQSEFDAKQDKVLELLSDVRASLASGAQQFSDMDRRIQKEASDREKGIEAAMKAVKCEAEAREGLTGRLFQLASVISGGISILIGGLGILVKYL